MDDSLVNSYVEGDTRIQTSTDRIEWSDWNIDTFITLSKNQKIYVRNLGNHLSDSYEYFHRFEMTGKIAASGNINSMLNAPLYDSCFARLFDGCSSLVNAPALPSLDLANNCYDELFIGCTNLTSAPALPATTLAESCYGYMFQGCSSLVSAPVLPALELKTDCYYSMFSDCTNLLYAPDLLAPSLVDSCYSWMFENCTKLKNAPKMSMNSLDKGCCYSMFYNCESLVTPPIFPDIELKNSCYRNMFNGCKKLKINKNKQGIKFFKCTSVSDNCVKDMFKYTCEETWTEDPQVGEEFCYTID